MKGPFEKGKSDMSEGHSHMAGQGTRSTAFVTGSASPSLTGVIFGALALYLIIYIAPLGIRPFIIPDETRYAEIPREMIVTGDWVVPRLNGIRYFEKPVMGYWLAAASIELFGENEFAARLPAALSAGLTSFVLFLLVSYIRRDQEAALLTAFIYLTFAGVFGISTFNVLDSQLTFFLTGACASFLAAFLSKANPQGIVWLALSGVFCGAAFLTKGFIAFAVPALSIAPFLIWEKRPGLILTMPWLPLLFAGLTAVPWAMLIDAREPQFWSYFFWVEHIKRFLSDVPQHPQPFWYFSVFLPLLTLPWSLFAPAAAAWYRTEKFKDALSRFALCWLLFPFLFFSASRGKLATYILPCLPPLAILMATGLKGYLEGGSRRALSFATFFLAALAASGAAAALFLGFYPPRSLKLFESSEMWKPVLAALSLTAWSVTALVSKRKRQPKKALFLLAAAPLLAYLSTHFILPASIENRKAPGAFLERHAPTIPAEAIIVSDEALAASVCWYYKRRDVYLLLDGGELRYGLGYPDAAYRLLNLDQFESLRRSSSRDVILITDSRFYNRTPLPEGAVVKNQGRFTIAYYTPGK
jgi:4-amino-4-deoxy-L-arabinose transferase